MNLSTGKQFFLLLFTLLSGKSHCQQNFSWYADSLVKINKVKAMSINGYSVKGNHSSKNVYHYSKSGKLIKYETISPLTNEPVFITDYFLDSSGKIYASVFHGGPDYNRTSSSPSGFSMVWTRGFSDSIMYYYQYNHDNQLQRMYTLYPSGKLKFDVNYAYFPGIISRKSYTEQQVLTDETIEYLDDENHVASSLTKKYNAEGTVISSFSRDFKNIYNTAGQLEEINYRDDTCACLQQLKYYANGLLRSHKNIGCRWNQKYKYRHYR